MPSPAPLFPSISPAGHGARHPFAGKAAAAYAKYTTPGGFQGVVRPNRAPTVGRDAAAPSRPPSKVASGEEPKLLRSITAQEEVSQWPT